MKGIYLSYLKSSFGVIVCVVVVSYETCKLHKDSIYYYVGFDALHRSFFYCVHPLYLSVDFTSAPSDLSHMRTLPFSLSAKQKEASKNTHDIHKIIHMKKKTCTILTLMAKLGHKSHNVYDIK